MVDVIEKIGMNSQTLRLVTDNSVIDVNIKDGSTGSHMINLMSDRYPDEYVKNNLMSYDRKTVVSEKDAMSWGAANDKMTGINLFAVSDSNKIITPEQPKLNNCFIMPSNPPLSAYHNYCLPPAPRKTFTEDEDNKTNFGNLFGK